MILDLQIAGGEQSANKYQMSPFLLLNVKCSKASYPTLDVNLNANPHIESSSGVANRIHNRTSDVDRDLPYF